MKYSQQKQGIDKEGYRENIGIIVCNNRRQVLWARRIRHDGWQFPQGGIESGESVLDAAFRELYEEVGLATADVQLLGKTADWLRYDVPYATKKLHPPASQPFRGQKQRWFLFHLLADESNIKLDTSTTPEFDHWRWVDYWQPAEQIVEFKRSVYKQALTELEPLLARIDIG